MKRVYLAGPIKRLSYDEATSWRKVAANFLRPWGIEALSPMRAKESLRDVKSLGDGYDAPMNCAKGITARDRNDVLTCDVVLAYLSGADLPSLGTAVEFGWADAWRKPVVAVIGEDDLHNHGMLTEIAGFVTPSLEEALDITCTLLNVDDRKGR